MEIVDFISNFHAFPNYGSGSRGFSKFMEIIGIIGLLIFVVNQSWKLMILSILSMISSLFAFGREPKETTNLNNTHPRRFQRPHCRS